MDVDVEMAPWLYNTVYPSIYNDNLRYFVIYGGRGSGKSEGIAQLLVLLACSEVRTKILCARHIQHSISESSKSRIEGWIRKMGLESVFYITKLEIINKDTGSKFIFKGLSNVTKENITSIDDVKYLWIEEAHSITDEVWKRTDPSIRAPDSKIFITFNPHQPTDIVYDTFVSHKYPRSLVMKINWDSNPWFSSSSLHQQRIDFKSYAPLPVYKHIWEGELMEYNENPIIYPDRFIKYNILPNIDNLIISVDTAYTTKESADYTALGAFCRVGQDYYILDLIRGRFEFDILYNKLLSFYHDCTLRFGKVNRVVIENKTAGISLLQLLRKNTKLPLYGVTPTKDKFTRVCEVMEILHSRYHIPQQAPWLDNYIMELTLFTGDGSHEHDDQVDITTQALTYLRGTLGNNTLKGLLDLDINPAPSHEIFYIN